MGLVWQPNGGELGVRLQVWFSSEWLGCVGLEKMPYGVYIGIWRLLTAVRTRLLLQTLCGRRLLVQHVLLLLLLLVLLSEVGALPAARQSGSQHMSRSINWLALSWLLAEA